MRIYHITIVSLLCLLPTKHYASDMIKPLSIPAERKSLTPQVPTITMLPGHKLFLAKDGSSHKDVISEQSLSASSWQTSIDQEWPQPCAIIVPVHLSNVALRQLVSHYTTEKEIIEFPHYYNEQIFLTRTTTVETHIYSWHDNLSLAVAMKALHDATLPLSINGQQVTFASQPLRDQLKAALCEFAKPDTLHYLPSSLLLHTPGHNRRHSVPTPHVKKLADNGPKRRTSLPNLKLISSSRSSAPSVAAAPIASHASQDSAKTWCTIS